MSKIVTIENYFAQYQGYFWKYDDNGEVIAHANGQTIVYLAYLEELLERLKFQGLPPLGALLTTLIAFNTSDKNFNYGQMINSPDLNGGLHIFTLLNTLPEPYRKGERSKLVLQAIFRNRHKNISVKSSVQLMKEWRNADELKAQIFTAFGDELGLSRTRNREWGCLESVNVAFETHQDIYDAIERLPEIEEEIKLDDVPSDVPVEVPLADESDLIALLKQDSRTFEVGTLVKRIWAGLNIPIHSSEASEQPLGGFSDISNKGSFDKLLISEFAHDDLSFLSRLANNESLYIQKEIPPNKNTQKRIILIDVSLKNWGTPKILAFATVIAIAKHPKSTFVTRCFLIGQEATEISFETVDDLYMAMQKVEPTLSAAKGLDHFFESFPTKAKAEVFVITETSNLQNPHFLKSLTDKGDKIKYLITSTNDGMLDVYRRTKSHRKHIQHIELPVNKLWQNPPRSKAKSAKNQEVGNDIPILYGRQNKYKASFFDSNGCAYFITAANKLYRGYTVYGHIKKGLELVCDDLPSCHGYFALSDSGVLLNYRRELATITLFDLHSKKKQHLDFRHFELAQHEKPSFIFYEGRFVHANSQGTWHISENGEIEKSVSKGENLIKFIDTYSERFRPYLNYNKTIKKRIHNIYIDRLNRLVIDNHTLIIDALGQIKFVLYHHKEDILIRAKHTGENQFIFEDGSVVTVLEGGMLVLQSSDNVPAVYIPTFLDAFLGIATETEFTGNTYFKKESKVRISIDPNRNDELNALHIIREQLKVSTPVATEILKAGPDEMEGEMLLDELENLVRTAKSSMTITATESYVSEQELINGQMFFDKYIHPFIYIIVKHAANA